MLKIIFLVLINIQLFSLSICEQTIIYKDKEFLQIQKETEQLFKDDENNIKFIKNEILKKYEESTKYRIYYSLILYLLTENKKESKQWLDEIFKNASSSIDLFDLIDMGIPNNKKYKKEIENFILKSDFLLERERLFLLARVKAKDRHYQSLDKDLLLQSSQMGCGIASFSLANYFDRYEFELPKEFLKTAIPSKEIFEGKKAEIIWDLKNEEHYFKFDESDLSKIKNKKQNNVNTDELKLVALDTLKKQYPKLFNTQFYLENDVFKQKEILKKYLLTISPKATQKDIDNFLGFILKYKYYYHYLHLAAEQGYVQAQDWLAVAYNSKQFDNLKKYSLDSFGQVLIAKDDKKAFYWYKKAALEGYKSSMNSIEWAYRSGSLTNKDITKSLYWGKKIADIHKDYFPIMMALTSEPYKTNYQKISKYYVYKHGQKSIIEEYGFSTIPDPTEQELADFENLVESFGSKEERLAFGDYKYANDDIPNILANMKPKQTNPKNWLMAIGTEKYDNTDEIKYSKNSTDGFVKVAKKTLGISERNTYSLIEEKSTSGAIKDSLEILLKNVKDGDTIYFYYSGHGIPVLPDNEPYILPKDKMPEMIGKDDFFKLRNIYKMLSDSKAKKVVAIVDSCFSGATDGVSVVKGIAATRIIPKKVAFDTNKMVVLTAGQDKQYSNMYEEKGHRLFSYFVMKALLKGKTDAKDIYRDVYTNVKDESYKMGDLKVQEPTMEGNENIQF